MHESSELHEPRSATHALTQRADDERARKVVAERHAAVRRWIDEDDEAECRGID